MLLSLRFFGFFEAFQEFAEAAFFLVENIDKSVNARFRNKPARESRKTPKWHRYDTVHRHHLVCRAFREDFCAENQHFFQEFSESSNRNLVDVHFLYMAQFHFALLDTMFITSLRALRATITGHCFLCDEWFPAPLTNSLYSIFSISFSLFFNFPFCLHM